MTADPRPKLTPEALLDELTSLELRPFLALYGDAPLLLVRIAPGDTDLELGLDAGQGPPTGAKPLPVSHHSPRPGEAVAPLAPTAGRPALAPGSPRRARNRVASFLEKHACVAVVLQKRDGGDAAFPDRISVGRAQNKDIVLRHTSISKFHAWFEVDGPEAVHVSDSASTNKTQVNGSPIEPKTRVAVVSGDRVQFGAVEALLCSPEALWWCAREAQWATLTRSPSAISAVPSFTTRALSVRPLAMSSVAPLSCSTTTGTTCAWSSASTVTTRVPLASFTSAVAGISTTRCASGRVIATSAYMPAMSAPSPFGTRTSVFIVREARVELAGGARYRPLKDAPRVLAQRHARGLPGVYARRHVLWHLDEHPRRIHRGELVERRSVARRHERTDLDHARRHLAGKGAVTCANALSCRRCRRFASCALALACATATLASSTAACAFLPIEILRRRQTLRRQSLVAVVRERREVAVRPRLHDRCLRLGSSCARAWSICWVRSGVSSSARTAPSFTVSPMSTSHLPT